MLTSLSRDPTGHVITENKKKCKITTITGGTRNFTNIFQKNAED